MFTDHLSVLKSFLSNDPAVQREAEATLNQIAQNDPNGSMDLYISALDSQEANVAELAAVSMKKYHLQIFKEYERIQTDKLELLEKKVVALLADGSHSLKLYKRLIEILVLVYGNSEETHAYLLKTILSLENGQNNKIKISIMYFIELLCESCFNEDHLKGISGDLTQLFEKYITDSDINVAIAAIKSIISFLSSIEEASFVKKFSSILPVLLQTLISAVKQDEDSGISIIQSLGDLIEAHPLFIKPIIEDLLVTLTEIMKTNQFTEGMRTQAMNCIETLANKCDVALRRSEVFKKTVIPAFMEVLCEVKEITLEEWLEDLEGQTISKNDPYYTAQDAIAKISDSLKSKFLLPQFIPFITHCIQNDQWYAKHAGYVAIGVLAEGSSATFKGELDQIMQLVLPGLNHQDPRVAYAATTAVALLSSEYSPDLQKNYSKVILESLVNMMNNDQVLRLQLHACRTIVNYFEKIADDEEDCKMFIPYADVLLSALKKLFQKSLGLNTDVLLEDVLNAISMLSSVFDLEFAKYANEFLPGLKQLLDTVPNTDEKHTNIRLNAIECMGFIVTSMRSLDGFAAEVDQMMEYFVNHQKRIAKDDPEQACIMDVYTQISSHMNEDFVKYLPHIFERILEAYDIEVKLATHLDSEIQDLAKKKFALTGKVDSNLLTFDNFVFDTSAFAIKMAASNTVFSISRNLRKAFYPYISYTLPLVVKYFDFHVKEISKKALKTMKALNMACTDEKDMADIFTNCLPHLLKAIHTSTLKEDVVNVHYILRQLNKGLDFLTQPILSDSVISTLIDGLSQVLTFCDQEKKKVIAETKSLEDYDDEKKEEIEKNYEDVNNLMQIVMEISGTLLKYYGEKVEGLIGNGIAPYYYNFLMNGQDSFSQNELLYSVCLFCDILEYSSMNMFNKASSGALQKFLELCKKQENLDIIHSSVFGLGVISKRMDKTSFKEVQGDILQVISDIITASDAFSEAKASLTENAISSLGKVALYQSEKSDKFSEDLMLKFLQFLPLKNDFEEAQAAHKMLLQEVMNKNEALICGSPEVQKALVTAISNINKVNLDNPESEILDDESKNLITQVISSF